MYGDEAARPHPEQSWRTCCVCPRELRLDEQDRVACRPCQARVDRDLAAIPGPDGLYARLSDVLAPGAGTSDSPRVATSRVDAPLPVRLAPLNLIAKGGVVTILQTWLVDFHDTLGWTYPRWQGDMAQQCDQVVRALRNNLDWAAAEHPAFDEFAGEVREVVAACRRQVTGERPERTFSVTCTCGHSIRATISTTGARCPACSTQYNRTELLNLDLASRAA